MTNGYLNRFGDERNWKALLRSGVTHLEAVATDWIFGTAPVVPPTGGGWWEQRRRRVKEEDELMVLL